MDQSPKYPSMRHLPWSREEARENKYFNSVDGCLFTRGEAVMTGKVDGSNVCLTRENLFARSHSREPEHSSFDMLKARWSQLRYRIPEPFAIYGEWIYATHSIRYDHLSDYLVMFSVLDMDRERWLSWDDTTATAEGLGIEHVSILHRGEWAKEEFEREPMGESTFVTHVKGMSLGPQQRFRMKSSNERWRSVSARITSKPTNTGNTVRPRRTHSMSDNLSSSTSYVRHRGGLGTICV